MAQPQLMIIPREKLEFGFDGEVPRYWLEGDPFKSRVFDAMSLLFPEGERFFILCVHDYEDETADPTLIQDIKDFTRQEAQHTRVHAQFNRRLKSQGIDVEGILRGERVVFEAVRKYLPRGVGLALTAAAEHVTAMLAEAFFEERKVLAEADPRVRAMYAWHAMEEVEHKSVAFDVMQKVARVGYFTRTLMMFLFLGWTLHTLATVRQMLRTDGFRGSQSLRMWVKGLWWLFKPGGLFAGVAPYLAYYRPGFHPSQTGQPNSYRVWREIFEQTGDPIAASDAVHREALADRTG